MHEIDGEFLVMIKQVLVIRKDLNMRKGKIASQAAHASMMFLVNRIMLNNDFNSDVHETNLRDDHRYCLARNVLDMFTPEERMWLEGKFTKICVGVQSEQELNELFDKAEQANLEVHMCIDSGLTEFGGIATKTCIAIGPDYADVIDAITGHLKLL
jgi:PTH2 family peptidyl-tRNA hydrolase